jgi:hypothetical protein
MYYTRPVVRPIIETLNDRMFKRSFLIPALLVLLSIISGCGGPEIDASNEHSLQASLDRIRTNLDTENRRSFDTALDDLNDMLFNSTDAVSQATISLYRPEALLRKILHGKTAQEVIVMVDEHRQKQLQ